MPRDRVLAIIQAGAAGLDDGEHAVTRHAAQSGMGAKSACMNPRPAGDPVT